MTSHRTGRRLRVLALPVLVVCLAGVVAAPVAVRAADEPGWLGVNLQPLDDDLRSALDLGPGQPGVLVNRVVDDGPADRAGIRADDVLVAVGGERVTTVEEAVDAIRGRRPGETVRLVVNRAGKERGVTVTLGAWEGGTSQAPRAFRWRSDDGEERLLEIRPEGDEKIVIVRPKRFAEEMKEHAEGLRRHAEVLRERVRGRDEEPRGFLGVTTRTMEKQLAEYFGAEEGRGVLVTSVVEESAAEKAGIRAGDVILTIGDETIADEDGLRAAIRGHDPGAVVAVEVLRDRARRTVEVTLGESRESFRMVAPDAPEKSFDIFIAPDAPAPGQEGHLELEELHRLDRLAPRLEQLDRRLEERLKELERKLEEMERRLEDRG